MKEVNENIFLLFISLILFTSCKKENKIEGSPILINPNCLLKSIESEIAISYVYDSSGRIREYTTDYMSGTVAYTNGGATILERYRDPIFTNIEFVLDDSGNAISSKNIMVEMYSGGDNIKTITKEFTYNSEQYLTKEMIFTKFVSYQQSWNYTLTEEINYEYNNRNLITRHYKNSNGSVKTWNYTFTDLRNQLSEVNRKLNFTGKQNLNLISTREEINDGKPPLLYKYSYKYNPDGNLIEESINLGLETKTRKFGWSCKK